MEFEFNQNTDCPSYEIAAYIDGELDAEREFDLDLHFASCQICSVDLNLQKEFLNHLDHSLKHEREMELPANFAKTIVANAESTVSGLRRPRERFNAMFICAALFLFVIFSMGAEVVKLFAGFSNVLEQIVAVGSFFGHIAYSVFIGVAIILRSLVGQVRADLAITVAVTVIAAVFFIFISQRFFRLRRA